VTVFPGEIYRAPKSWTEKAYPKLVYFSEVDKGGHFAAWEQPELLAAELRGIQILALADTHLACPVQWGGPDRMHTS
jgi:hypothetical protein